MQAWRSRLASFSALSLFTIASPSASAQPASPAPTGPSINEVDGALDIDITSKRLDEARQQIQPSLGATKYQFDQQALEAIPQGSNADMNQVVLQSPGVWQDSFGQIHIRGEMANVQYRINGVEFPKDCRSLAKPCSRASPIRPPCSPARCPRNTGSTPPA